MTVKYSFFSYFQANQFFDLYLLFYKDNDKWDKILERFNGNWTKKQLQSEFYSYNFKNKKSFDEEQVIVHVQSSLLVELHFVILELFTVRDG